MALGSSIILGTILVVPLLYLILGIFKFIRTVNSHVKCVLQWPGPARHWLTGNITQHPFARVTKDNRDTIGNEGMQWALDMMADYPRGFSFFYSCIGPTFQANHPECAKAIFKRGDPKPLTGPGYNLLVPWIGKGLVIAKGNRWARNRRLLTPAFHFEILRPYMGIYNEKVEILLDKMRKSSDSGESFKVTKNVSLCTLDIMLQCAFSQQSNCQIAGDNDPYVSTVKRLSIEIMERYFVTNPLLLNNFVYLNFTSRGRQHQKDCDYVHKVAEDVIKQRRQQLGMKQNQSENSSAVTSKRLDFLDILISARDEDGVGLTELEIRNEVDTFMFAGHDTTASSLSWMLYALAKHPEHQRKVQDELDQMFEEKGNENVEWEDLVKLKYLSLCIKETLRLYPPVPLISRCLEKDTEIDGRILKAGLQTDIHIYALHRHPDYWTNPEEYNPERFLPENSTDRDPYCYVPFSAGPRNCIGQNFAMYEEKVILARVLYNFEVRLDTDHEVNFGLELVLKPSTDIKVVLNRRR